MTKKKIAWVVTDINKPLDQSSIEVIADLQNKGVLVEKVSWLGEADWNNYNLLILNGCSGYHQKITEFNQWLKSLPKNIAQKVYNPVAQILWNVDKSYLLTIEKLGFAIADSIWIDKNSTDFDLEKAIKNKGWKEFIIKPTVSAGSHHTQVFNDQQFAEAAELIKIIAQDSGQNSGVIIQEFMKIIYEGEFSAIFFNKKFSHLILKVPKSGDYRAGIKQGAEIKILDPKQHQDLIDYATKLVEKIDGKLLYARVDIIKNHQQLLIMELEIIEPILYLGSNPQLIDNYTKQIIAKLDGQTRG